MELLRSFFYFAARMGLLSLALSWEMHGQFRLSPVIHPYNGTSVRV
jgi:hypothetical protein